MIRYLLLVLFLFVSLEAGAATRYVNGATASNGFGIGNDTTGDGSLSTPWATASKAVTTASDGDTIVFNCGTYTNTGSLTPTVANLILQSYTPQCATITSSSGTNSNLLINLAATGITVGDVILDGAGTKTANVTFDAANNVAATFTGTKFKGARTHVMTSMARVTSLTMNGGWDATIIGDSGTTNTFINGVPSQTSTWSITNGSGYFPCTATATTACQAILLSPPGGQLTATVSGVKIGFVGTGSGDVIGIKSEGVLSGTYSNNTFTYSGSTDKTVYWIQIPNDASDASTVSVTDNSGTADALSSTTSIGFQIGNNDVPTTSNNITVSRFSGNYSARTNHGFLFGYIANAKGQRNVCYYAETCFVSKTTTGTTVWESNIAYGGPMTAGALRARGDTGGDFRNNTVLINEGAGTSALGIYVNESPEAANSGTTFRNNAIASIPAVTNIVNVDAGDTATFRNNAYLGGAGWKYQSSTYADLAAWQAVETTAIAPSTMGFVGKNTSSTVSGFKLSGNSLLRRAGTDLNLGNIQDYSNRAFSHPPSIGAYEAASGDEASTRTNR
jgi:uncharacterized metal-binding protein